MTPGTKVKINSDRTEFWLCGKIGTIVERMGGDLCRVILESGEKITVRDYQLEPLNIAESG